MSINIEERDLPGIWVGGYHTDRIDWYTRLVIESELVKGGAAVIPELIAAMICESSLDNLVIGNNAKNGATNPTVGVGWMQLDTGYHVVSLDVMHALREEPLRSLMYVTSTADLCTHGGRATHFNKQRWHAWEPETIDPATGWSPMGAALDAWERVNGS